MAESQGVCFKNSGFMCEVIKADTVCSGDGEEGDDDAAATLRFDRKKRDVDGRAADTISFDFTFKLDPYFYKDNYGCDDLLCREKYETLLEVRAQN